MKNFQLSFVTNKSVARWLQILNEFEKNEICSASHLSELTNSTTRTIGKDIGYLNEYFGELVRISSTNLGYCFELFDYACYEQQKASFLANEPLFILLENIFIGELKSIDEWADHFYLSKATLLKYLQRVRKQLIHFDLELANDPVNIIGNEADIRNFFCTFFYETDITPHTVFPSIAVQQAVKEISGLFDKSSYHTASFSQYSYILYISIERFLRGETVLIKDELHHALRHSIQLMHYQRINEVIRRYFHFYFTSDEIIFLFVSIITKRKLQEVIVEQKFCLSYNHWPEIGELTNSFYQLLEMKSTGKRKKNDLILIESFFTMAKLKECLSTSANRNINDVNEFIQDTFSKEFYTYKCFLENNKFYQLMFSEEYLVDFCANLVIYIEAVRERYWFPKKNIAFIFEGNNNIVQYIEGWSKRYFGHAHQLYYPDSGEVNAEYIMQKNIDLLVTNYAEHAADFRDIVECIFFKA
ncbi:helix-turn-helix domain-containing protein [Enterococcus casseliflavus]|uniref:helix-turn-helix domain-containing protein n=1 Tax=Enterococcus casseliflavus TaxID=37734 RepID=UPI001CD22ABC|nr:helix-turn-helix domain-containing protein [Enterococcus casseliflavus]